MIGNLRTAAFLYNQMTRVKNANALGSSYLSGKKF